MTAIRVALTLALGGIGAAGCATSGTQPIADLVGRQAPDFTAGGLGSGEVRLSSFQGRVVVLHIWAAWCKGCEEDLPAVDDMAQRLRDVGVSVVAVSLDTDTSRLVPIMNLRSWRMIMLHDPSARVGALYEPTSMPALFLIDRVGVVRRARMGVKATDLRDIEAQVRELVRP